jgi:hypothetical protein
VKAGFDAKMNTLITSPKSRLDTVVVFLVLLQIVYCCWEVFTLHPKGSPWQFMLPSIAIYAIILFALPGYIRGQKWAWAMIFLFSLYVLHQTIILNQHWHDGIERSLALLEFVASPLCLWILSSTAKNHSICRQEFAKVLGAIAVTVAVIFVRGNYFSPIVGLQFVRSFSPWVFIEAMSQITAWRMLMLLWCSYAGICIIAWIAARYIPTRSTQAHP